MLTDGYSIPTRTLAALGLLILVAAADADVVLFPGPAYDASTGNGFEEPYVDYSPGQAAGNGVGLGYADKNIAGARKGFRALRWFGTSALPEELGTLGTSATGYSNSIPYTVSSNGTVVGFSEKYEAGIDLGERAVRWDPSTTVATELGNLGTNSDGYTTARAFGITSSGVIVGGGSKYEAGVWKGTRGIRWSASDGEVEELEPLGTDSSGFTHSSGQAINEAGTVVGSSTKYEGGISKGSRPVRWNASSTTPTELGNIGTDSAGFAICYAWAVNSAGTTVGWDSSVPDYLTRAIAWQSSSTTAILLGTLDPGNSGITQSRAYTLNDAGTAVGWGEKRVAGSNEKDGRPVRWDTVTAVATELGNLGYSSTGHTYGVAFDINSAGLIVGGVTKYNDSGSNLLGYHAVLWGSDGVAIDLNSLLTRADAAQWELTTAYSISDSNWITGVGRFNPDGHDGLPAYDRLFVLQLDAPDCRNPLPGCAISDIYPPGAGNCAVDLNDLGVVLANFSPGTPGKTRDEGDLFPPFNGDGVVNLQDLGVILTDFGTDCR